MYVLYVCILCIVCMCVYSICTIGVHKLLGQMHPSISLFAIDPLPLFIHILCPSSSLY